MFGRILRATGTVLVTLAAIAAPVLTGSTPASADTVVDGCTIVSNPTPTNFTNCPGADLSGADLSGVNLSYANLSGADFIYGLDFANLSGADLSNANLSSAGLAGLDLSNVNLSSANLTSAALVFCFLDFSVASCPVTTLSGATLTGATLADVTLATCSNFSSAPDFSGCGALDLSGLDLSGVNFTGATLVACQPPGVSPPGCDEANLTGAILTGANFTGTELVPSNRTVTSNSSEGVEVAWPTPPSLPGAKPGPCRPPSRTTFPVGTTTVTCVVKDDAGDAASGTFQLTVVVLSPLRITTDSLPAATIGRPYSAQLSATGGNPPYRWSHVEGDGTLPRGLHLDHTTGVISGTATTRATKSQFTVQVKDTRRLTEPHAPETAQEKLSIRVR